MLVVHMSLKSRFYAHHFLFFSPLRPLFPPNNSNRVGFLFLFFKKLIKVIQDWWCRKCANNSRPFGDWFITLFPRPAPPLRLLPLLLGPEITFLMENIISRLMQLKPDEVTCQPILDLFFLEKKNETFFVLQSWVILSKDGDGEKMDHLLPTDPSA